MPDLNNTAVIMAGGTGGHIFPGLAVARELQNRGWRIVWLGSIGGMEEALLAKENAVNPQKIQVNLIPVAGLRGKGTLGWLKAPFSLASATYSALKVISQSQPVLVIGFGGFASGPGGLAAKLKNIPLIIHEQNAVAGLTNKVLAKLAKRVFLGFPGAFKQTEKVVTVGNPIRKDIVALHSSSTKLSAADEKDAKPLRVLVIGGSRGAFALNKNLPGLLSAGLNAKIIELRHQVGAGRLNETQGFYQSAGVNNNSALQLEEFIDDMAGAFKWAQLVICRAGASTVSEVAAAGVAAVFIPYPFAVDDHQSANANWLAKAQAALCISETELTQATGEKQLKDLLASPEKINLMANKAREMALLDAAEQVADYGDSFRSQAA